MDKATRAQTPLGRFEKGSKNRPAQERLGSNIVAGLGKIGLFKKTRGVSKRLRVGSWLLVVGCWVVSIGCVLLGRGCGLRAVCCKLLADCWWYMRGWGLVVIGVLVAKWVILFKPSFRLKL